MDINAVVNHVCENVTYGATTAASVAYTAAEWMGRAVCVLGQGAAHFAQHVTEWATPFFATMGSFLVQNQGSIAIALTGVTLGALGATIGIAALSACEEETQTPSPVI